MHSRCRINNQSRNVAGFTMIEMLVTLTIFGFVLSSLVIGLRTGIVAWRNVRLHQTSQSSLERAFEILHSDIDAVGFVHPKSVPIEETVDEAGSEELALTVFGAGSALTGDAAYDWATVRYTVDSDSTLIRTISPMVGPSNLDGGEADEHLLDGVRSIGFDYFTARGSVPVWEDRDSLPAAVEVTLDFQAGPSTRRIFPVSVGFLQTEVGQ